MALSEFRGISHGLRGARHVSAGAGRYLPENVSFPEFHTRDRIGRPGWERADISDFALDPRRFFGWPIGKRDENSCIRPPHEQEKTAYGARSVMQAGIWISIENPGFSL
ncbi:hypothetical protein [Paracoccus onubensis]|uniref:Uncharacterized protein n=1 Tax=Paracoccus onubensis TaxID=1675788 RepID=A0A418SLU6_9RHOB|nr:hypothetical protein [Paracoccus onubensis]RJE81915.1 hypothetical protein D3P04_22560 [Paracoccus onubensis]